MRGLTQNRRTLLKIISLGSLAVLLGIGFGLWPSAVHGGQNKQRLEKSVREWLEKDVVYIITKEEKEAFLRVTRDEDRQKFIERFWEIRNPTPGAPTNPYKEEHYRRIEYANQYFSEGGGNDGWRTDRGRVYITLGPPAQRDPRVGYQKLRPLEIWFYSAPHPALPPFFYVIFYQREIGDYRLYSPYFDGPEKLITTSRGANSRIQSLRIIDEEVGREVARTTLTLLPDEPVDFQNATSSLQSDLLLSAVRNLANHPLNKLNLERARTLLENVTTRIVMGEDRLKVFAVSLRDANGNTRLHYVLRLTRPEDLAVAQDKEGRYYYSLSVTARILGPDGKLVFTQERKISRAMETSQLDQIKSKVFGYEDWLPLPAGNYTVEFRLDSPLTHTVYEVTRKVVVPEIPAEGLRVTEVVPFSEAEAADPNRAAFLPFAAAGVKFKPMAGDENSLSPIGKLNVFYQIWAPPRDPRSYGSGKLDVEYAYGRPAAPGEVKRIHEQVDKVQFDPFGSLVNGKKIPLENLQAGNYRMTVSVLDPESQQKAYATLTFRVMPSSSAAQRWDASSDASGEESRNGEADYQRGLCYLTLAQKDLALNSFQGALQKNPSHEGAREKVVDLYFSRAQFADVASVIGQAPVTIHTKTNTILRIAESLEKIGETQKAVSVLESALAIRTGDGVLYEALASLYRRLGNTLKAAEIERKAKMLMEEGRAKPPSE